MPNRTFFKTHEDYLNWYRKYKKKNKEKLKKYHREYERLSHIKTKRHKKRKIKRNIDPKYRLNNNISSLISCCLKGKKAGRSWEEIVGYKIEDLITHLEKQFDKNMNWDNYGSYWHLDHIKPKSLFNYTSPKDLEFKKCWALKNLQPMEKIANIKKGNKF